MVLPPKYPSTFHWPWSPEVHRDDSTHSNPESFVGVELVISEKLDGGNTCLCQGEVFARSTGQPATQGWFAMVKKHHAWKTNYSPANRFHYGEDLYGIHSIEYSAIPETQTYRIFNIREDDTWLSWDDVEREAAALDILTVPVRFRGKMHSVREITQWMEHQITLPSQLGPNAEGFVMRHADQFNNDEFQQKVAKFVRKGHVQTDEHWTKNWQPAKLTRDGSV